MSEIKSINSGHAIDPERDGVKINLMPGTAVHLEIHFIEWVIECVTTHHYANLSEAVSEMRERNELAPAYDTVIVTVFADASGNLNLIGK